MVEDERRSPRAGLGGVPAARLRVRDALAEDAPAMAQVVRAAMERGAGPGEDAADAATPAGAALLMQTGSAFLVGTFDDEVAGLLRYREEEGVAWFDLLVSALPGAGRKLIAGAGIRAQDHGVRLARTRIPDRWPLTGYFARLGYVGVSRERGRGGAPILVVERRLPLLTVREQRRSDAAEIARLTGRDPWPFEQNVLPGWFVLADGDRVAGVVAGLGREEGVARITTPVVEEEYRGRGLELWMVERAAYWAETNGYHTLELEPDTAIERIVREFEDRRWAREDGLLRKRLVHEPSRWEPLPEPD